jgi:hypothetical protein
MEMPKTIAKAIFETARAIEPLVKLDSASFAKFSYVSIDDYYDKVATVAREHGLLWRIRDAAFTVEAGEIFIFTYTIDLFTEAGEMFENYDHINVPHKMQGAQTCGSARSYAEKVFMRTLFKVVTGEPDADYFAGAPSDQPTAPLALSDDIEPIDPNPSPGAVEYIDPVPTDSLKMDVPEEPPIPEPDDPGPQEEVPAPLPMPVLDEPAPTGDVETMMKAIIQEITKDQYPLFKKEAAQDEKLNDLVMQTFIQFVPTCKSYETLRGFWNENIAVIDALPAEMKEKVRMAFNEHRDYLAEQMGIDSALTSD